ncbi:acyl-CoA dehydrogenase [Actinoplanes sp. SE50]|uniref:acyl-CoA dehydrogenase family protein n=1 Tax=unclassified Actinoplanes TaxID=2626549 RepID=UPI00023EC5B7|nr:MULTISPECIES: acyl-CoA dehydrogenase family protein [unclassified Actinoplanes]AEV83072.1 Short-chain specific acyl-CoA dehydrogenase [Actinoplanes sp. SE50/110]ATO81468.1 acyl-CoA dehydrogenase [Actinoplanes sp. SE50]SLL98875.1 acyl-CoA dehydrogenase [Actinoplanes sp. SE50/110]
MLWEPPETGEQSEWLSRVAALAPLIERHRAEADRERRTPQAVFEALRDAGIPRMWVSTEFGGGQVGLHTGSLVIQALARLDASVAWQMGVQGAIGRISDYLPEQTARELFKQSGGLVVGAVNPAGRAEETAGGYRISGRWGFASGSAFADWLVCAAPVHRDGQPVLRGSAPELRMLFVPVSAVRLLDNWHTLGLRGTGSNDFEADDVFVPAEYTVDQAAMLRPPAGRFSRAYPIGYYDFGPFTSASTAAGVARDAVATVTELVRGKVQTGGSGSLARSHVVQDRLARATMHVHTARTLLRDTAERVTESGESGGERLTATVRLTAATVAELAVQAVDIAYDLAGSTSLYETSRLERAFRDVHSAVKHITLAPQHFEMVGQYLVGGELRVRR